MIRNRRFAQGALGCALLAFACASAGKPPPSTPEPEVSAQDAGLAETDPLIAELTKKSDENNPPPAAAQANVFHAPKGGSEGDSQVRAKADFRSLAQDVRGQIRSGADAAQTLDRLEKMAEDLGPSEQQEAADLAFQAAAKANDHRKMKGAAERWLHSCGPEHVGACRSKALSAMEKTARGPPKDHSLDERVTAIHKADKCLAEVEASAPKKDSKPPSCLGETIDFYRRRGDRLMLARALYQKANTDAATESRLGAAISEMGYAQRECTEPRCAVVRRKIFERLVALNTRAGDFEEAAKAAIESMAAINATLTDTESVYSRPKVVSEACSRYDEKAGPGSCRALEKKLTQRYSFHDFSKEKGGQGLSQDVVRQVAHEYGVLIDECLREEASRMIPPAIASFTVQWVVNNSGQIEQLHMEKKDIDDGPLARCLRAQAATWRYPWTTGELQHVEQSFTVKAVER